MKEKYERMLNFFKHEAHLKIYDEDLHRMIELNQNVNEAVRTLNVRNFLRSIGEL